MNFLQIIAKSRILPTIYLLLLIASFQILSFGQTEKNTIELKPDRFVKTSIKGGETHIFQFDLKKGKFVRAEVEQKDIDVIVMLFDTDGQTIIEMNGDLNYLWRESVSAIAAKGGKFKLQITGKGTAENAGSYTVKIAELRKSLPSDSKRIEAEQILVQAIKLDQQNKPKESAEGFEKSLKLWREIGDTYWEAVTTWNLAYSYYLLSQNDDALKLHSQALEFFKAINDRIGVGNSLRGIGNVYQTTQKFKLAEQYLEESLIISRELKRPRSEFSGLSALVPVYKSLNQTEKVLENFKRMLEIVRELKDRDLEIQTLKWTGDHYKETQNYKAAIIKYEEALSIHKTLDENPDTKTNGFLLLKDLYSIHFLENNFDKAIKVLDKMLIISQESNNLESEASVLREYGLIYFNKANSIRDKNQITSNLETSISKCKEANALNKSVDDLDSLFGKAICSRIIAESYRLLKKHQEAISFYKLTLKLIGEIESSCPKCDLVEANTILINDLGLLYLIEGQEDLALEMLKQVDFEDLEKWKDKKDILKTSTDILNDLYNSRGDIENYDKTIKYLNRIVENGDDYGYTEVDIMGYSITLGNAYLGAGYFDKAFAAYDKSLTISRKIQKNPEAYKDYDQASLIKFAVNYEYLAKNNLGIIYLRTGNLNSAETYIRESVDYAIQENDLVGISKYRANLGVIHTRKGNYQEAFKILDETIPQLEKFRDEYTLKAKREKNVFDRMLARNLAMFVIVSKYYYGMSLRKLGKPQEAIKLHQESAQLAYKSAGKKYEARARIELGLDYLELKKNELAFKEFDAAYGLSKLVKARDEETAALDGLMRVWESKNNPNLAIIFGKQSINLLQKTRAELEKLGKSIASEFVKDNSETYRKLADLLIQQGSFAQAEKVLAMLKHEEYFEFVRRDKSEISTLDQRVPLKEKEKALIGRYALLADKIVEISQEFIKLDDKKRRSSLSADEQTRYKELEKQLDTANAAFKLFLEKELVAELGTDKTKEIEVDRNLQSKLRKWGEGTVALYTVAGADRYRVILTTPKVQVDGKTEIRIADLNKKVFAFRDALKNPSVDPRPLGKELYDILIKPIEKELKQANAKTLVWSLDGTLRYIPLAALSPDGTRYLVEDFQNVIITPKTRDDFSNSDVKWQALGLGVSAAQTVANPDDNSRKIPFSELPGTERELLAIVRDEKGVSETGVLPGRRFMNKDFTTDAFKDSLIKETADGRRKYNVIHIASHFRLGSNWSNSFLLLGNGKILTLEEINNSSTIDFGDVELVTLSACNTGFGNDETNGKEIDSLASVIQTKSGKAVLATLWAVADESTSLLMSEFYRLRQENPKLTKAEAIRMAQLEMLRGKLKATSAGNKKGVESFIKDETKTDLPKFVADKDKPFAHPYYWSPFVLIGNWR